MHNYTPYVLLDPIVQEKIEQDKNQRKISKKRSKGELATTNYVAKARMSSRMSPSCSHQSSPQQTSERDFTIAKEGRARGGEMIPDTMFFMFRARHGKIFFPDELRRFGTTRG